MLGGASEPISRPVQLPVKPWEALVPTSNLPVSSVLSAQSQPAIPAPPLPFNPPQEPSPSYQNQSNWSSPFGSNFYGGGYGNRFSYPSSFSSGFNSYSSPYYNSGNYYGNGPPAPSSFITTSLENTTRPLFDSINHILQAINHVASFIDSTFFAVWTSVSAAGSLIAAFKSFKNVFLKKLMLSVTSFVNKAKQFMKSSSGRRKLLVMASILALIPIIVKSIQYLIDLEVPLEQVENTSVETIDSFALDEDSDISSKAIFVRALYGFDSKDNTVYLSFNPGDVILVSKTDEAKLSSQDPVWIVGKLKDGSIGYHSGLVEGIRVQGLPDNHDAKQNGSKARIKKIMQLDNEIGKVALATPILISKALEVFMQNLVDESCKRVQNGGSTKLEAYYLKQCINEIEEFDFLKDIVENVESVPSNAATTVQGEDSNASEQKSEETSDVSKNPENLAEDDTKTGNSKCTISSILNQESSVSSANLNESLSGSKFGDDEQMLPL